MHDSHQRSVIKGISWRLIGSADTALLSFLFTGEGGLALKIAGAEFISKIALFYLHERVWHRVHAGKKSVKLADGGTAFVESHWRSLYKGISWRITGTLDTVFWAAVLTRNIRTAFTIGSVELITKIFLFYLHERAWMLISWGRKPHNLVRNSELTAETTV